MNFRDSARELGVQSIDQSLGAVDNFGVRHPMARASANGLVSGSYVVDHMPVVDSPVSYDDIYGGNGRGQGMYDYAGPGLWSDSGRVMGGYYGQPAQGVRHGTTYGFDRSSQAHPHSTQADRISIRRVQDRPHRYSRPRLYRVHYSPDGPYGMLDDGRDIQLRSDSLIGRFHLIIK
jgi:hypothetical protein